MASCANACSPWSRDHHKNLPRTLSDCVSNPSSPIPIPRRKTAHPPPCSPVRDEKSPDFAFNFDFSISPDAPAAIVDLFRQHRQTTHGPPHSQQNMAHIPFSALAGHVCDAGHPYEQEPFLYAVPKMPLRDTRNTQVSTPPNLDSLPPSIHTSETCASGGDENMPLTSAFHAPLVSESAASSPAFSQDDPFLLSWSPPSPVFCGRTNQLSLAPTLPKALRHTSTAAPVVSLSIAQAERSEPVAGVRGRSRPPISGINQRRARRRSSVGAEHDLRKIRDCGRRMGTVVGRGAGRVVSLVEYKYGRGKSLVSDEDIECSLEKERPEDLDQWGRGRSISPQQRGDHHGLCTSGSLEVDRGRARERAQDRGTPATEAHPRALPGWQWVDI